MKLWNFIKENMLKNPGQRISENEKSLSFEEALLRAEEFAGELRGTACCAVLCASEMSAAGALLACFAAGVTALLVGRLTVLLNPVRAPRRRLLRSRPVPPAMQFRLVSRLRCRATPP